MNRSVGQFSAFGPSISFWSTG